MKRDGKYRFSLQFGSETREQMQAGELLERLGNRKSAVVIAALNAYIAAHHKDDDYVMDCVLYVRGIRCFFIIKT